MLSKMLLRHLSQGFSLSSSFPSLNDVTNCMVESKPFYSQLQCTPALSLGIMKSRIAAISSI